MSHNLVKPSSNHYVEKDCSYCRRSPQHWVSLGSRYTTHSKCRPHSYRPGPFRRAQWYTAESVYFFGIAHFPIRAYLEERFSLLVFLNAEIEVCYVPAFCVQARRIH